GRRDFRQPFRVLVAGGGTGDAVMMLGQHLADRGCPAELVYLDLSTASRAIAEARAAVRGLTTVRFVTGSLLELPSLGLGRFDYIDCCGVLHHLPDPGAALSLLAGALSDTGGIGLMLYGAVGRTGVYDLQAILRRLAPIEMPAAQRVETARRRLQRRDQLERAAVAALIVGNIKTHPVNPVRAGRGAAPVARPDDPEAVPVMRDDDAAKLAAGLKPEGDINVSIDGFRTTLKVSRLARPILTRIDGRRTLGQIQRDLAENTGELRDWASFVADFQQVFRVFNGINSLFL